MTNKEAIGHIMDIICENNTIKPNIVVFEQEKEALYMAIKALEQEPILDKIRAEIEEYKSRQLTLSIGVDDLENGKQIALEYVLAILDKYKTGK